MRAPMKVRLRLLVALMFGSLFLSACDFDVYSLPLPGGTSAGDDAIRVEVMFADVLDLVPQSTVKVNDVSVGQVTDVELEGTVAKVTIELRGDTELPDKPIAEIRQTSLLGEKFVSLKAPEGGGTGELGDGDVIPIERTGRNPEVEEVLGALSLLLNGGGVAQLKTITRELNLALEGREDSAKSVLTQIDQLMGQLADNKDGIVDAIESLNRLSVAANKQQGVINSALAELPSALTSLDAQRGDLVKMLQALNRLGDVGVRVIRESKDVTIDSIRQLQPVLTELANSGDSFVKAFNVFLTYPFVDEVVGRDPQVARNLHMGDYTNLSITLDLDLGAGLPSVGVPCTALNEIPNNLPLDQILDLPKLCQGASDAINKCLTEKTVAACQGLPGGVVSAVCAASAIPIPVLCPRGTGSGGGGTIPLPDLPLPLPDLPGALGGLGRTGFGDDAPPKGGGPTMGQLMEAYDPDLVSLLVPGMVIR
ncbi:MCE family protein [Nocardioides sp. 503]|uniref:MCE family protein n=1 Tax=Nocardioides sp. 503 TaxID=2508326 RepID=UPI00107040F9|nr:MCE family protein [Nocardioides sp. 503]